MHRRQRASKQAGRQAAQLTFSRSASGLGSPSVGRIVESTTSKPKPTDDHTHHHQHHQHHTHHRQPQLHGPKSSTTPHHNTPRQHFTENVTPHVTPHPTSSRPPALPPSGSVRPLPRPPSTPPAAPRARCTTAASAPAFFPPHRTNERPNERTNERTLVCTLFFCFFVPRFLVFLIKCHSSISTYTVKDYAHCRSDLKRHLN